MKEAPAFPAFDESIIQRVAFVQQQLENGHQVIDRSDIKEFFSSTIKQPIQVIDYSPENYEGTIVFNLPMGNGLNDNMLFWLNSIALTMNNQRLISFANPAEPGQKSGIYKRSTIFKIFNQQPELAVLSQIDYLRKKQIKQINLVGYSLGAEISILMSLVANNLNSIIDRLIVIEPVGVSKRNIFQLALDFIKAGQQIEPYLEQANSTLYLEKFQQASRQGYGEIGYILGILRLSNIILSHEMSLGNLEVKLQKSLDKNPNMKVAATWGDDSEICYHNSMVEIMNDLQNKHPSRIQKNIIEKGKHALGDNIFLLNAIIFKSWLDTA